MKERVMKLQRTVRGTVLATVLVMGMSLFSVTSVLAGEIPVDSDQGRVVQIAIPNENGELQYYTGEKAQKLYDEIQKQTEDKLQQKIDILPETAKISLSKEDTVAPMGMFTYKYRFVKTSSGTVYGKKERITNYLKNQTSVSQSMSISAYTQKTWSINTTLTGKYKDTFSAAAGAGWQNTSTLSMELNINVPSKRRVWLEFQPRYNYVRGEVQKYYVTRGPKKVTVIQERKPVYSKSPKTINVTLGRKRSKGPDGIYTWKEDRRYQ